MSVKISELSSQAQAMADDDIVPFVDASSTSTEKITFKQFSEALLAFVSINTDATSVTVGGTLQRSGYYINKHATANTAITYNLPSAVTGMQFVFKNSQGAGGTNTGALTIHPSSDAYIEMDGVQTSTSHKGVISGGAAGDMISVLAVDGTHWSVVSYVGTWTLEA